MTSAAWVAGCGDSLFLTFQAKRQSTSIPVRQEYGGLRIHPLWDWTALCAFLGHCGSFMWPVNESGTSAERLWVNGENQCLGKQRMNEGRCRKVIGVAGDLILGAAGTWRALRYGWLGVQ